MKTFRKEFETIFRQEPVAHCFAPGRVNLIGEHTDYNGGYVFPCALGMGIHCLAARRADKTLRFYSENFARSGVVTASLDAPGKTGGWTDYVRAVIRAFAAFGYDLPSGADFYFSGNVPDGAGLSSSAALEVVTGAVLRELFGFSVTDRELAVIGQFAENRFIGVSCGIMDQFASAMGRRGNALLLNTDTLELVYAPLPTERVSVVIVNSRVKHSLASSAYNDRRRECETALAQLNTALNAPSLCAVSPDVFEARQHLITDEKCRARARHAVYENSRAAAAAQALRAGDIRQFGALMNQSHISLRDDYEVSCPQLDFLAETAWNTEGVLGARMTGGGFGGCTVNLVEKSCAEAFINTIQEAYQAAFKTKADAFVAEIGGGVRVIEED